MGRANLALVGIGAINPLATVFRHEVIPSDKIRGDRADGRRSRHAAGSTARARL